MAIGIPITYQEVALYEEKQDQKIISEKLSNKTYYAILDIPKINLKKELYPLNDPQNNVNKTLYVLKESLFPKSDTKSNIIIAGHSGNGKNAYFKNLYKLNIADLIKIYYQNILYSYQIKEIEYQNKVGTLYLKEDYSDMLTLITCTKGNKKTQTIYYAELINTEKM